MTLVVRWPDETTLVFNGNTVFTHYPDGTQTGGPVVAEDHEHAALLGISPIEHRLAHELGHHLVSRALSAGKYGCPVLWASAHNVEMPAEAKKLEWYVTVISYLGYGKPQRFADDYGALTDLQRAKVDVTKVARQLRWIMASEGPLMVSFGEAA